MVANKHNFWFEQAAKEPVLSYSFASLHDLLHFPRINAGQRAEIASSDRAGQIYLMVPAETLEPNGVTVINTHFGLQAVMTSGDFRTLTDLVNDTRPEEWYTTGAYINVSGIGTFEVMPSDSHIFTHETAGGVKLFDLSVRQQYSARRLSDMPHGTIGYLGGIPYQVDKTAIGPASDTNDLDVDFLKEMPAPQNITDSIELARKWAEADPGQDVTPGHYSARHWSDKAQEYAEDVGQMRGDWEAMVTYGRSDRVTRDGSTWYAVESHNSSASFDTDLNNGKWAIFAGKGDKGEDGIPVEISKSSTHVMWRYEGDSNWTDLIALADITGVKGDKGDTGLPGTNGSNGIDGADGREIELRTTATQIQWRYVDDPVWTTLTTLASLRGPQGEQGEPGIPGVSPAAVEMQRGETHLQWRYVGEENWTNLIPLSDLAGQSYAVNEVGPLADRGMYDNEPEGFAYLTSDGGELFVRYTSAPGTWTSPIPFGRGEAGHDGREIEVRFSGNEMQSRYVGEPAWRVLATKNSTEFFRYSGNDITLTAGTGVSNVQEAVDTGLRAWPSVSDFQTARTRGYNRPVNTMEQIGGELYQWGTTGLASTIPSMSLLTLGPRNLNMTTAGLLGTPMEGGGGAREITLSTGLQFNNNRISVKASTQVEAEAGSDSSSFMTPIRTKNYVDARIATLAEGQAGQSNTKLMTPYLTRQMVQRVLAISLQTRTPYFSDNWSNEAFTVTRVSAGRYQINFNNPVSDNYIVVATASTSSTVTTASYTAMRDESFPRTANGFRIVVVNNTALGPQYEDPWRLDIVVHSL